ncbi:unnamed protein product [Didymodactylos carnosus]|uniref:Cadherin domain-containing protein n=1 Tax=Didymodactylos carnosus TaxID=1234261 RepID=A0A8S2DQW5_9BILA|nr:unnamed protein product [Didymodactylos carnosus]CAF3727266.1 unnamed protein product [Didymodactylos carnosus]
MFRLPSFLFLSIFFIQTYSNKRDTIHIMEDLPIGSAVYTFPFDSCSSISTTHSSSNSNRFSFIDGQRNQNQYFLIDPFTGRVTTKKLIDRDDFCLNRLCSCERCEINLEVLCLNSDVYFTGVSIIIDDLNDHTPRFDKQQQEIEVLENVPVGYIIPLDAAIDRDYGNNSIQGYKLVEDKQNKMKGTFQLHQDLLSLHLMKSLDREICDILIYTLVATDGGQPPLSGRMKIIIKIIDVNDNSPIMDRKDIYVQLSELTPINNLVTRIHAIDGDSGLNGQIRYTIQSIDPPSANKTFKLDLDTGELKLAQLLDYEIEKHYSLKIRAADRGQGSMPAIATVNISIKDENDNKPLFMIKFAEYKSDYVYSNNTKIIYIKENAPNGTFLGHISINDNDEGENGRVNWKLDSNNTIYTKEIFNNEAFFLFTNQKFDRELNDYYEISLFAIDNGQPPNTNIFNFSLIILDENDNEPIFDQDSYTVNIHENISVGSIIISVHATDLDQNMNGLLTYRLLTNDNITFDYFNINEYTGDIHVQQSLDREIISQFIFEVSASDNGQPSLISTVNCTINILDINDNKPIFLNDTFEFYVSETQVTQTIIIGQINATDLDEGENGQINYKLIYNKKIDYLNETTDDISENEWPFYLTLNGTLYLKGHIDYEQQTRYDMSVMAYDRKGLNTTVPLIIHIQNRNDWCPELKNQTVYFFINIDEWNQTALYNPIELTDGDNDTCEMILLNFNDLFKIEKLARNIFNLKAIAIPYNELYELDIKLRDIVIDGDKSCEKRVKIIVAIGNNQTNQSQVYEIAQQYLETIRLRDLHESRQRSYFDLTLVNIIGLFIILCFLIILILIVIRIGLATTRRKSTRYHIHHHKDHPNRIGTLYRLQQEQTETQLPLLANNGGEHSLTSSLIVKNTNGNENIGNDEEEVSL